MSRDVDFIFAMSENELEETSSYSTTSFTSKWDNESSTFEPKDDVVDPLMDCSPKYFSFNRGAYELMVKNLLGIVYVMIESLKDVTKGAPLNLNSWGRIKNQNVLGNETPIYLKESPTNLQVIM